MRWRNEAEKKIVLEAAAEWCSRYKAIYDNGVNASYSIADFEQWLQWYLSEELHLQSVHAYMRSTQTPAEYAASHQTADVQQPSLAENQRIAPANWTDLLAACKQHLPDKQYRAVLQTLEANKWQKRQGEKLIDVLDKITSPKLQDALVQAWQEA